MKLLPARPRVRFRNFCLLATRLFTSCLRLEVHHGFNRKLKIKIGVMMHINLTIWLSNEYNGLAKNEFNIQWKRIFFVDCLS